MTLYMCDYDWSSGSFVFKLKQSHFHPNRSINHALQVSGHALFTSTPHVFLLNIFINKTERSIHFY
jgi:hypothetical protein